MEDEKESQDQEKTKTRKRPTRAEFQFPIYTLSAALGIAGKVESEGAGSLSEAALAIAMGASSKSSGFKLKVLTAKQFGLLVKQGDNYKTTELAKLIFKPVSPEEKATALAQAFHNISLFKAVSERYKGSPLPTDEALKNILEREFKITQERVSSAQSMLINSAQTAGVLQESHGKVYLVSKPQAVSTGTFGGKPDNEPPPSGEKDKPFISTWSFAIDTKDLTGMDAEAIKATMEGLERLAKIVTLRQKIGEESDEKEK